MVPAKTVQEDSGARFEPSARSAFRVLGLSASATQAEVFEAAEALRLSARLGVEKRFESDLAWLGPVSRTESDLRDALGRLADPPRRAAERLFWFHAAPATPHPAPPDGLRRAADRLLARGGPAARHDAALFLLAALHTLDPRFEERAAWAEAFRLWRAEVDAEEFWSLLVAADLKGEYEQALTFAEAAELRLRTPRLVSCAVADAAVRAAAAENHERVGRALTVLRAASLPRPLLEEYENEALGPLEERAEEVCDLAFGLASLMAHNKTLAPSDRKEHYFDPSVYRFCSEAKPELFKFLDAAGPDSYHLRRLMRHAAARLGELAGYYRAEGWADQAVYLYGTARALAPEDSAEFGEADAALRALETGGGSVGRVESEYVVRLAHELSELRPPPKLFKAAESRKAGAGHGVSMGCLVQIAFFALAVVSCLALNKCGVIKTSRPPSLYNLNSFNFNYRVPVPQFSPVPLPELLPPGAVKRLTPAELRRRMRRGPVVVFDVRPRAEYEAGHLAGARSAPGGEVEGRLAELRRRGRPVVFYCASPADEESLRAARRLWLLGLRDVSVLEGGLDAWRAAGLPIEKSVEAVVPPEVVPPAKGN
jgi:rhodanese-related sulfurtransferase